MAQQPDARHIAVVIVDDHPIVRQGLAAVVAGADGLDLVGQFEEGSAAMAEIVALRPQVVVMDIAMADVSGMEVCRELRKRLPAARVLFMSMYGDARTVARAMKAGGHGYFSKRAPVEGLPDAIRTVARGGLYFSAGISPQALKAVVEGGPDPYDRLTGRERQVVRMIAQGLTVRQIADELGAAIRTINVHRHNAMKKLDIHTQPALVKYAFEHGIVSA